jgi:8-amino-7-oxononanoate synthase
MDPYDRFVKTTKAFGIYPPIKTTYTSATTPEVVVDKKKVITFCSNNYLGLANDERLKKAAKLAIDKYGLGCCGSRLISGNLDLDLELEREIAAFKGKEDAIIFTAGFMSNSGTIPAIMDAFMDGQPFKDETGAIFSDELNHASIVDGCRLSKVDVHIYKHKDMDDLERLLKDCKKPRKLIITDGVFSMDGDVAPLDKIVVLAKKYKAMTMVDDAHGTGVIGKTGRGTPEYFDVEDDIDIVVGTFSKAFGAAGGFLASRKPIVDFLRVASRTYVFSATMSPPVAAAILEALRIIKKDLSYKNKLFDNYTYLLKSLQDLGFNTMDSETPVIPILIGAEKKANKFAELLFEQGIFAPCVRWPATPKGMARIRVTLMASHDKKHLDKFIQAAKSAGEEMGII